MNYDVKRRHVRIPADSVVTIDEAKEGAERHLMKANDICIGGCSLYSTRELGKGRILIANIVLGTRVVRSIINVVSEIKKENGFRIGVEFLFLSPDDYDSLSSFIEERLPAFN